MIMKKLITISLILIILSISFGAEAQITVTDIAVKESNVQGWSEVKWQKCANTSLEIFETHLKIIAEDTTFIIYNSKPFNQTRGMFITDATIVSTGETLRIKFLFGDKGLSQIYFLTVPKASGFYLSEKMIINIDGENTYVSITVPRT